MDNIDERKIYELGYLLVPYLPAEEAAKMVEQTIKSKILAESGEVTSELAPVMTRLAYVITKIINNKHTKFSDGYFGAVRFKALPEAILKLKAEWDKDDNFIRFLLISLPKGSENMTSPKRSYTRLATPAGREDKTFEIERLMPEKGEEKTILSAEELDKEIDKLVEPAV